MKRTITRIISSFAVCLMMIFAGTSNAATYTAIASGNWSYTATWSGGNVPPFNVTDDEIVIGTGFVINLDQDLVINRTGLLASASLTVDGELRTAVAGRKLTMTRGTLNGSGTIQMGIVTLESTSTIGFSGTLIADELNHSLLSLASTGDFDIKQKLSLMGGLTIGGELKIAPDAKIIIDGGSLALAGTGSVAFTGSYDVSYMNGSSQAGPEMGGAGLRDVTIDVGNGNDVTLNSNTSISGMLTLSSGELVLDGNHLTISGDVANSGSGTIHSTSSSDINIEGDSVITGELRFSASGNTVRNLTITRTMATSAYISIGTDLEVSGILNMSEASLYINDNTLDIMSGGSIVGANKDHYVMTSASGYLGLSLTSGGSYTTFPVGTRERYAPAAIKLTTGTGMVRVSSINEAYANGTAGTDLTTTEKMIRGSWNITSGITTGISMDMKLMWSQAMEVNAFDRTKAYISHYSGGSWDVTTAASATSEANAMWSITRTGVTSLSPFAVMETGATGIADINAIGSASVYPNPATDYIMINNVEHVNVEIMNELGQVVKRSELNGSAPLSLSDLDRGNYFIRISSEDASTVKKFVKL